MNTYIIFVYGTFDDHEDVEYFCINVLGESQSIESLKYVIGNEKNIAIIFDTKKSESEIVKELSEVLDNENILFYLMFRKNDVVLSYIPETIRNLIYKPSTEILKIEYNQIDIKRPETLSLDDILEKIEKKGIKSLTEEEKKYLDNFDR